MATHEPMTKVVEDLSDALDVLTDFEKFYAKLVNKHYDNLPGIGDLKPEEVEQLHVRMNQTKAVLVHYAIGLATSVVETARITTLLQSGEITWVSSHDEKR